MNMYQYTTYGAKSNRIPGPLPAPHAKNEWEQGVQRNGIPRLVPHSRKSNRKNTGIRGIF